MRVKARTSVGATMLVFCGRFAGTAFTVMLQPFARRLDAIHLAGITMLAVLPSCCSLLPAGSHGLGANGMRMGRGVLRERHLGCVAYLFWYADSGSARRERRFTPLQQ